MEEKMKELVEKLNQASEVYYNTGNEMMSNKEYDALYDELVSLEKQTGIVLEDSPTKTVGYKVEGALKQVRHEYVALSLAKTKDITEFPSIFNVRDGIAVVMWKMDGSTVVATYNHGVLEQLATRGNGEIGQDITHNAPYIEGLPMKIAYQGKLIVRGEAVMSYEEFNRINNALPEDVEHYKNPRNLANATITMLDSREMRKRKISFHAFQLVYSEDALSPDTFYNRFLRLHALGFHLVEFEPAYRENGRLDNLIEVMNGFSERVEEYPFPVDGLVVAANDIAYAKQQPGTGHNPNKLVGYAFKWEDETVSTTLRKIEWSASRTGLLNPVAVFDPVELEGTTVTRASLHNVSFIKKLRLRKGDTITVYKANKIIPQVSENLTMGSKLSYLESHPVLCPVCGEETASRITETDGRSTEVSICTNCDCPAKAVKKFVHFASRDCMNITGFSDATIEKFVSMGFIKEYADFFRLEQYKKDIVSLEGFGVKSFDNLVAAANKARHTSFVPFIHALGIPCIGKGQAKLLEQEYAGDVMQFFHAAIDRKFFSTISGIGEIMEDNIWQWGNQNLHFLQVETEESEIKNLLPYLEFEKKERVTGSSLANRTFVITGNVYSFANREEMRAFIESHGGKVSGSVSGKTSYLVNNDIDSMSGKNKKAKELGVPIISEEQLLKMIANQ